MYILAMTNQIVKGIFHEISIFFENNATVIEAAALSVSILFDFRCDAGQVFLDGKYVDQLDFTVLVNVGRRKEFVL